MTSSDEPNKKLQGYRSVFNRTPPTRPASARTLGMMGEIAPDVIDVISIRLEVDS
jgi:hypothetical protein